MGEVQHLGNAVDHGVAQGDDGVDAAQGQAVDQVVEKYHHNDASYKTKIRDWPGKASPCGSQVQISAL